MGVVSDYQDPERGKEVYREMRREAEVVCCWDGCGGQRGDAIRLTRRSRLQAHCTVWGRTVARRGIGSSVESPVRADHSGNLGSLASTGQRPRHLARMARRSKFELRDVPLL